MRKKHSQEIALFFIIVDCLFLVPLIPLAICLSPFLLFYGVLSFFGLFTPAFASCAVFLTFIFVSFSFIGFGFHLLLGYLNHFQNYLTRKQTDRLWVKTIIYNAIFFFPAFYIKLECRFTEECAIDNPLMDRLPFINDYPTLFSLLTLWWFLAIFMSFMALFSMGEPSGTDDVPKLNIP